MRIEMLSNDRWHLTVDAGTVVLNSRDLLNLDRVNWHLLENLTTVLTGYTANSWRKYAFEQMCAAQRLAKKEPQSKRQWRIVQTGQRRVLSSRGLRLAAMREPNSDASLRHEIKKYRGSRDYLNYLAKPGFFIDLCQIEPHRGRG